MHPDADPWGKPFSASYDAERCQNAGKPIGPGGRWRGVLEGITCDQDYLRLVFNLTRGPNTQLCCHLCDSIQWLSNKSAIGPLNNVESLYTVYGPREGDTRTLVFCFKSSFKKTHH